MPEVSSLSWAIALAQLRLLTGARGAPQLKQLGSLAIASTASGSCSRPTSSFGVATRHRLVALGGEPRLARIELGQPLGDDGKVGARDGLVEAHQDVAFLDAVAVAHAHLADHAAARVLHLLHVGIDDERAGGDQRAGNLRGRRPAADPADQQDDEADASG